MLRVIGALTLLAFAWSCTAFLSARPVRQPSSLLHSAAPTLTDHAPSWESIKEQLLETDTGKRLFQEEAERLNGRGPPSAHARLRLFNIDEPNNVRVILHRDASCWCPYCQKVWILLEEKQIPYQVKTVPLNAYGDKPVWYTQLVDGGKLPAMELDGTLHVESLNIMKVLDATFGETLSDDDTLEVKLLELEKLVQRDWFSFVFYPVEGEALQKAKSAFLDTMKLVNEALGATSGPWFGGQEFPSLMDIQYIPMMERIEASVLYWRNLKLRGMFPNIDAWVQAWETRPSYMATKSDYYTLCLSMPSQNGPGYFSSDAKDVAAKIYGLDGAWELSSDSSLEPIDMSDDAKIAARYEAVYRLLQNHENICNFCARAAGEPGRPAFHAELADPYATPNEDFVPAIDVCLRHVSNALVHGAESAEALAKRDIEGLCCNNELLDGWEAYEQDGRTYFWNYETGDTTWTLPTGQLDSCLAYLRDRIGVPRDMSYPAARQLRMHLNWAIALIMKNE